MWIIEPRGLTVLHINWAYQILTSKTADNRGPTVFGYVISKYTGILYTVHNHILSNVDT